MRTASRNSRRLTSALPMPRPAAGHAATRRKQGVTRPLCAAAFLAGYPLGIWWGSKGGEYAAQLVGYILSAESYTGWQSVFGALLSGTFLLLLCIFAAGFCAVGTGLLCLLFAGQGVWLGFCAAAVYLQEGTKALLMYRALLSFQELASLALCLWLAEFAGNLCAGLYLSVFDAGVARGRLQRDAKRLALRFVSAVGLGVGISAVGGGIAVFVAGVLL